MEELIFAIRGWNPWWNSTWKFPHLITRDLMDKILPLINVNHIKDIIGIRRAGKSTFLMQIIETQIKAGIDPKSILFLNFEDPVIQQTSFTDLLNAIYLINPSMAWLFLDEIQEKKGFETWIRTIYDTKRFEGIFISGSSASLLKAEIGRILTGRHLSLIMYPFSFREYLQNQQWTNVQPEFLRHELARLNHFMEKFLRIGGFPEVTIQDEEIQRRILTDLFKDIIYRDIVARNAADPAKIQALATYVLTNWTRSFSYNKIATALKLHVETVEKYLGYLEEAFLIFVVKRFAYKLMTQYREEKKIYVIDPGLRNFIAFQTTKDQGKAAENAVFLELMRREQEIYFWKDEKHEIDFCITKGANVLELIQVVWDINEEATRKREISGIIAAARDLEQLQGTIITRNYEGVEFIEGIKIIYLPLAVWLLEKNTI